MELPPPHVLAQLDAIIVGQARESDGNYQNVGDKDDGDSTVAYFSGDETAPTQEDAAHAVNAAIRRAGLEGKRRTNPVVDGQLVPRARKRTMKRRRDEPAATPSPRARRPRRAVNYDESESDDEEEDLELGPPDAGDGWD